MTKRKLTHKLKQLGYAQHYAFDQEQVHRLRQELRPDDFWRDALKYSGLQAKKSWVWSRHIGTLSKAQQKRLDKYRKAFLEILLNTVKSVCAPFCKFQNVGSVSPTSDIDIGVHFAKANPIMELANELTVTLFGEKADLDALFDINFYASVWYDFCGPRPSEAGSCHLPEIPAESKHDQVIWSALRLYENRLQASGKILWSAIPAQLRKSIAKRYAVLTPKSPPLSIMRKASLDHLDHIMTLVPMPLKEYYTATSRVAFYEHDAYLSIGAYIHVVLCLQKGSDCNISEGKLVMSLLENAGFWLHVTECKDVPASASGALNTKVAISLYGKSMKYLTRMFDAITRMENMLFKVDPLQQKSEMALKLCQLFSNSKKKNDAAGQAKAIQEFSKLFSTCEGIAKHVAHYIKRIPFDNLSHAAAQSLLAQKLPSSLVKFHH